MVNPNPRDRRQKSRRQEDSWRNRLGLTWQKISYALFGALVILAGDYTMHHDARIRESMTRSETEALVRQHDDLILERVDLKLEKFKSEIMHDVSEKVDSVILEVSRVSKAVASLAKQVAAKPVWLHFTNKRAAPK